MNSVNNYESTWGRDILIVVLILAVGFAGGFFVGQENNKYKTAIDQIVPEISEEIFSLNGEIVSISGNSFVVETTSLDRQLPGTELKTRMIKVNTNSEATITEFDPFEISENPEEIQEREISFSDLAVGDAVSLSSPNNIMGLSEINSDSITRILQPEE